MLHVEDAVADNLRAHPVAGVDIVGLVDTTMRLAPERVWAPAANAAIVEALQNRRPTPRAVVVYAHREYDPVALFPNLRMAAKVAGVAVIDGRTGRLIRRDPTDRLREVERNLHPALRAALDASVPQKEKKSA